MWKRSIVPSHFDVYFSNIRHVLGFFYVITLTWFCCELLKHSDRIADSNYARFNASDNIYNLVQCYVYAFTILCFLHRPLFLTDRQPTAPDLFPNANSRVEIASPVYVLLVLLSAATFALLGEARFLQFSLNSEPEPLFQKFQASSLCVYVPAVLFVTLFCAAKLRYVYGRAALKQFLFPIVSSASLYACVYVQCAWSEDLACGFHLHHSFLAGWVCLFTAEASGRSEPKRLHMASTLLQCATLGIFVQGINFFGPEELKIITIKGDECISFLSSTVLTLFLAFLPILAHMVVKLHTIIC